MRDIKYTISDALGIHARPAGMLVKEAGQFNCDITIYNGDDSANAKRVMKVMGLAVKCGDTIRVECNGDDEAAAAEAMSTFLAKNL